MLLSSSPSGSSTVGLCATCLVVSSDSSASGSSVVALCATCLGSVFVLASALEFDPAFASAPESVPEFASASAPEFASALAELSLASTPASVFSLASTSAPEFVSGS